MSLELDNQGFLAERARWSPEIAVALARTEGIELTPAHWEIIELVRDFHARFEVSPAMRPLVKHVRARLGAEKGTSLYLLRLFPGSPAKVVAKIAGLPRPTNCL